MITFNYHIFNQITNEHNGVTRDYTRKSGVIHTEILLPNNATTEYADRTTLWNAVEKIKKALTEVDKILFKAAHSYFKDVMNGHSALPVSVWKTEYSNLIAEHRTLNQRYLSLKNEVKEAEQIRKSVYSIS